MLDYRVETFLTAAKTLNYTTAAKLLHITQPAVSTHIRQLEEEYQTKLFEQKGKQLNLTENGHLFFQLASRMKNDDHHMRQHFLSDAAFQELSFGTTLTIADYCMKEPLMRLWKQFPNLRLRLTVQNTDVLLDQIQCGQLDLAIVEGYVPKEAFDHALFQTQEYIAVCHPDHVFSREVRSLQDLCGEPLFIREPGSGTRAVLEHTLSMQELSLQDFLIVGEIGSLHTIKQCVLADLGLAFFYRPVVERELRDGGCARCRSESGSHIPSPLSGRRTACLPIRIEGSVRCYAKWKRSDRLCEGNGGQRSCLFRGVYLSRFDSLK